MWIVIDIDYDIRLFNFSANAADYIKAQPAEKHACLYWRDMPVDTEPAEDNLTVLVATNGARALANDELMQATTMELNRQFMARQKPSRQR